MLLFYSTTGRKDYKCDGGCSSRWFRKTRLANCGSLWYI